MKRLAAPLAALALASCGGPDLYAEIEIPDLRVTLQRQQFPAFDTPVPGNWCDPNALGDPPCVALAPDFNLSQQVPALDDENVKAELRLTHIALTLSTTGGGAVADLSGIRSATVYVGDPGTAVATYTRTTVTPPPTTLAVTGRSNLDLAPYLVTGNLPVRIQAVIDGNTPAFEADITAAFYVRVRLDYGKYLGL